MSHTSVDQHLGPTLARLGFASEAADNTIVYGDRPAWAVYCRSADRKLQTCWSAREDGMDVMLAPIDAPDSFELAGSSDGWRHLLARSAGLMTTCRPLQSMPTRKRGGPGERLCCWPILTRRARRFHRATTADDHIRQAQPTPLRPSR